MRLFRPVGLEELRLVYEAGLRAFPPRLPDQPIFYPVTSEAYAAQIARDWNTTSGSRAGFVTAFDVADAHATRYERRIVGSREHEELWVPAEELPGFNAHIEGRIEITQAFFGAGCVGLVPSEGPFAGLDARGQLARLAERVAEGAALDAELAAAHVDVFLGWFFWEDQVFSRGVVAEGAREAVLAAVRRAWRGAPLGVRAR